MGSFDYTPRGVGGYVVAMVHFLMHRDPDMPRVPGHMPIPWLPLPPLPPPSQPPSVMSDVATCSDDEMSVPSICSTVIDYHTSDEDVAMMDAHHGEE